MAWGPSNHLPVWSQAQGWIPGIWEKKAKYAEGRLDWGTSLGSIPGHPMLELSVAQGCPQNPCPHILPAPPPSFYPSTSFECPRCLAGCASCLPRRTGVKESLSWKWGQAQTECPASLWVCAVLWGHLAKQGTWLCPAPELYRVEQATLSPSRPPTGAE